MGETLRGDEAELWFGAPTPRGTPQKMNSRVRSKYERWTPLVKTAHIVIQ